MTTFRPAAPKDPLTPSCLPLRAAAAPEAIGNFLTCYHEGDAMKTVTAEEMRAIDRRATSEFNIPSLILMENAGRTIADAAFFLLKGAGRKNVTIFCGSGNNGGDGLVAARYIFNRDIPVTVITVKPEESFKGDALQQYRIARSTGVHVIPFAGSLPEGSGLVIDALLGTGIKGTVSAVYASAIKAINAASVPVLAVDIPSGIDADTGAVLGTAVKASFTVTMGLPKTGMLTETAGPYIGELFIADIGFPRQLLNK